MTNGIGLATPGDTQHAQPDITPAAVTGTDALHALERQYGTVGLEQAITAWQADKDVQGRDNVLHQAEQDEMTRRSLDRMRHYGLAEVADECEANWKATQCAELLRPLVDEFGVRVVEQAARRLIDTDPVEQARIKADVRRAFGVDSARSILGAAAFAELFPEDADQPERLAQVIPFPTRPVGGAA